MATEPRSTAAATPTTDGRWGRLGRFVARRGWVHVVLLAGAGVFLLPFVWMIAVSLKTDDEAASGGTFPAIPTFQPASPAVRPATPMPPPTGATASKWAAIRPVLLERAKTLVVHRPLPPGGDDAGADGLRSTAAAALVDAAAEQLQEEVWSQSDSAIAQAFDAAATPERVDGALAGHLGRLDLVGLEVHDNATDIETVVTAPNLATAFHVESGPGVIVPLPDGRGAYLRYGFRSGDDAPVVLRADFRTPIPAEGFQSLVLSYTPDDSWHRLEGEVTVGEDRWVSVTPTYLAGYRPTAAVFQRASYADTTGQPRTWVSMQHVPVLAGLASDRGSLRLTLRPSSTAAAIWGKIGRNYRRASRAIPVWTYIGNSLILVALNVAGSTFSAAFVAYAFARLRWPGRSAAFALLLGTMMLPAQVTMIPSFMIWRALGWYNTLNPLWVSAWTGSAFFIFLMVQFMKTIPRELEEAARIDGLNALQTWWYVIVPLVRPTLAAIAIMVFMASWNDFLGPLVMLRDPSKFPLSLGLFGLNLDHAGDWTLIMAGNLVMTLPVVAVFFLFQRYFIEGVTVSGMKG